ncbi:polysaccharide biosynthesis tyrosine autokinase [Citricoccus sp. SGAir0253]|uniref:polysaccharide biosynthesis tyrosine autokinase n=1 Tax=Citricoccus sp. SGAir0253 TaxID=2567881 RepID=UPI0010CD070C|nr:polysaccharide biosynthesis tyrosine autokinase [Citricoccus sp. SGAir0253]QCU78370.1 polysaccharide biosynthesis tyrosine autokinase [Citricoccus sp. SGAir0253]
MDLRDYIRILRNNWLSILLITLLGVAVAAGATALTKPTYTARTQIFVAVNSGETATDILQGSSFSEKRVTSYVTLATSPRVLQPVVDELGLDTSAAGLAAAVEATAPPQTVLINLTASDQDPAQAARIANAVAESLITTVYEVEDPEGGNDPIVDLSVVEAAAVPLSPSSPRVALNLVLGLVVGAALGVAFALLRSLLDSRIRSREDVERITDAPVLGSFPDHKGAEEEPLISLDDQFDPRAENYRQLRTHLKFTNVDGGTQSVVVTSSIPGEGKTTTTCNLGIMLAESGSRVLVIDADLRRPRVAKTLGLEGAVGLSTILSGQVDLEDAVQSWGPDGELDVITSGEIPPNPSELLGSEAMRRLLRQLEGRYDVVLLDAPPLQPVTDPSVLAAMTSGVMLVHRVDGYVHREQLQGGLDSLASVEARLLGLVLTRVPSRRGAYYAYQYAYESDPAQVATGRRSSGGGRPSSDGQPTSRRGAGEQKALTGMRLR